MIGAPQEGGPEPGRRGGGGLLTADAEQIGHFVRVLFVRAESGNVALRVFRDDKEEAPAIVCKTVPVADRDALVAAAVEVATTAARMSVPVVFCPPICTFNGGGAKESDLCEGLTLSVEADAHPARVLAELRRLIGEPTVVVASGGVWTNPDTGEAHDKLHVYYRLSVPSRTKAEHDMLKRLRKLVCRLVDADASGVPIVHPMRWAGSWHRKAIARLAWIVEEHDTEIDLEAMLAEVEGLAALRGVSDTGNNASNGAAAHQHNGGSLTAEDLLACAERIANDESTPWDAWCRIGMAFWGATGGSKDGFAAFDAFSRKSPKYDAPRTRERWDKITACPPSRIGAGTLVFEARRTDPSFRGRHTGHAAGDRARVAEWPTMQPLPDVLPDVPALPLDLIPAALRPWIADATDRLQVPAEMIAAPAVVSIATLVGRTVGIYPKRCDDWLVVPNLWGMVVGRPGTMNSPAVREGTRFLRRLAANASADYQGTEKAAAIERAAIAAEITAAKRAAEKKGADLETFKRRYAELQESLAAASPTERRYTTQDATVEKIGEILLANPRGILMLRDELSGWLRTLDRPGREGDREFFLEAWNGEGGYTVDRIGRGTLHIPALCLSVFGTVQPGKLRAYLAAASEGGVGDDGLVQRFQVAVWPDVTGAWRNVDRWPDSPARERAATVFAALDRVTAERVGAVAAGDGIPALRFSPAAQALFDEWRGELEDQLRCPALVAVPIYEAHAAKYRSLMPTLALLVHLVEVVDGQQEPGPVTLGAARTAATLVDYLDGHARRLYSVDPRPARVATLALAERIQSGDVVDGTTLRDVWRPQWSGLQNADLARAAADELVGLGWVRIEERETGGRPSPVLRLHPGLRGEA